MNAFAAKWWHVDSIKMIGDVFFIMRAVRRGNHNPAMELNVVAQLHFFPFERKFIRSRKVNKLIWKLLQIDFINNLTRMAQQIGVINI